MQMSIILPTQLNAEKRSFLNQERWEKTICSGPWCVYIPTRAVWNTGVMSKDYANIFWNTM